MKVPLLYKTLSYVIFPHSDTFTETQAFDHHTCPQAVVGVHMTARSVFFTLLLIVYPFAGSHLLNAGNILWDTSHGPFGEYHLDGEYSQVADLLQQEGFTIEQSEDALDARSLWNADILVVSILSAYDASFTTSEVERITSFVNAGGGLVIMADNSQVRPQRLALLLDVFGLLASTRDDIFNMTVFGNHPVTEGIEFVVFDLGGGVDVVDGRGGEIIGWDDWEIAGLAVNEQSEGAVILVGDADLWSNRSLGIEDNVPFAVNCFSYADRERNGRFEYEGSDQVSYLLPNDTADFIVNLSNPGLGTLETGVYIPDDVHWLTVDRQYHALEPDSMSQIRVTVSAAGLLPDQELNTALTIFHNDPESDPVEIQYSLHVLPAEPRRFIEPGPTGQNHSLLIRQLTIMGEAAAPGLEIGVFTPQGLCAGSVVYRGEAAGFPARGDDLLTEEIEGFLSRESFRFRLYLPWEDRVFGATATFERGPNEFIPDALSILTLEAGSPVELTWQLRNRWSTVSLNLLPPFPDFEIIFASLLQAQELEIVKDGQGRFWDVESDFSNLGAWNITRGYMVRVAHPTQLTIEGIEANPRRLIRVEFGWSIIGFLPREPQPVPEALSTVLDNLRILKRDDGAFFLPEWDWDGIGTLVPGKGYHIALTAVDTLIYPELEGRDALDACVIPKFSPSLSSFNMSLLLHGLDPGSRISAVSEMGTRVGGAVVENDGRAGFPVWGDDPETLQCEGLAEGEVFSLVADRNGASQRIEVDWEMGKAVYSDDGISVGMLREILPEHPEIRLSGYPNPFNDRLELQVFSSVKGTVELTVYDLTGRIYLQRTIHLDAPGLSTPISLEAATMPAGVIIIKATDGQTTLFSKSVHLP